MAIRVALLLALVSLATAGHLKLALFEERKSGHELKCDHGAVVWVKYASYGRFINEWKNCHALISMSEVQARCNNEPRCFLEANNDIFGNPCNGVHKQLEVAYECYKPSLYQARSKTICENQRTRLSCPKDSKIFIFHAVYGRLDESKCRKGNISNTSCYANESLPKVRSLCHHKRSCYLKASVMVFGDPCRGTHKYLQVIYACQHQKDGDDHRPSFFGHLTRQRKVSGHQNRTLRLWCPRNGKIVVTRAHFDSVESQKCKESAERNTMKAFLRCYLSNVCYISVEEHVFVPHCSAPENFNVEYQCLYIEKQQPRHQKKVSGRNASVKYM